MVHFDLGISLFEQKQTRQSIEEFSAALAIDPNDQLAITSRAFAYLAVKDVAHAVTDLSAAHEKYPNDAQIDEQIGLADWQLSRYAEAREAFIRLEKRNATAWFWAQLANAKLGRTIDQINDPAYAPQQWPNPLKELYMGRIKPEVILAQAMDAPGGQVCDTDFYVGEWFVVHDDMVGAKPLLAKAVEDCGNAGDEGRMAAFELARMAAR